MIDKQSFWVRLGKENFHRRITVLIAMLGLIVAIGAATGIWYKATKEDQITKSTENSVENLSVQQNTQGDNSPAISNVRGNVIINQSE